MFKKLVIAYDHRVDKKYIDKTKEILNENEIKSFVIEDDGKANDYPVLTEKAIDVYKKEKADGLILFCGSGIGMCMVANKFDGIRSFVAHSEEEAYFARRHENSNCIAFGVGVNDDYRMIKPLCRRKMGRIILTFLTTEFEGDRHIRRLGQITEIEKEN